ncbi:hypothetical protein CHS0354_004081 [Potamilus streckersoni]|uniref:Uncharacterized protein n=1 Tax=Potamilus streckersoni TaxID=2493646 RepID=A0AAE0T8Y6_9BIVA|nr:hypothetical protein CHS0354_004081 [Potamilus streckersoni]
MADKKAINIKSDKEAINTMLEDKWLIRRQMGHKVAINTIADEESINTKSDKKAINTKTDKEAKNIMHNSSNTLMAKMSCHENYLNDNRNACILDNDVPHNFIHGWSKVGHG